MIIHVHVVWKECHVQGCEIHLDLDSFVYTVIGIYICCCLYLRTKCLFLYMYSIYYLQTSIFSFHNRNAPVYALVTCM